MSHSTPCPYCATPIPHVVASAPFCPYCGKQKDGAEAARVAALRAAHKAQYAAEQAQAKAAIFSRGASHLCLTFDARAGYALFGGASDPPRLRAYDLYNKRVAWEGLQGVAGVDQVEDASVAANAGNVYVGVARTLYALDLYSGAEKWRAELSDKLRCVADPGVPGARGTLWAVAVDDTITALDRDTGQPLWRETRESMPRRFLSIEGHLLLEGGDVIQLVDPATKKVLDHVDGRIRRLDLDGRCGLLQVHNWGWRERDGVLVHDFVAKKELLFEPFENIEDDVGTIAANGRVYCALEDGAKLAAGPKGKSVELVPAFHIKAMAMCGPTLMVLLRKHHGTNVRRLVGVDPQTLAVRFDLGELATYPYDNWGYQLVASAQVAVLVTNRSEDDHHTADLVALDPSGRTLWKLELRDWRMHYFLGGLLVVLSSAGWQLVRPDTGEVVGALAR